jgi:hypothetical protein
MLDYFCSGSSAGSLNSNGDGTWAGLGAGRFCFEGVIS